VFSLFLDIAGFIGQLGLACAMIICFSYFDLNHFTNSHYSLSAQPLSYLSPLSDFNVGDLVDIADHIFGEGCL